MKGIKIASGLVLALALAAWVLALGGRTRACVPQLRRCTEAPPRQQSCVRAASRWGLLAPLPRTCGFLLLARFISPNSPPAPGSMPRHLPARDRGDRPVPSRAVSPAHPYPPFTLAAPPSPGGLASINAAECGVPLTDPIAVAKCSREWSWWVGSLCLGRRWGALLRLTDARPC